MLLKEEFFQDRKVYIEDEYIQETYKQIIEEDIQETSNIVIPLNKGKIKEISLNVIKSIGELLESKTKNKTISISN